MAIYYFDINSGDDTTGVGSIGNPYKTFSKANTVLTAGDIGYFRSGTWISDPIIPANSGTSSNYITYKAYPGETVILDGASIASPAKAVDINTAKQYIEVNGFEIQDWNGPAVEVGTNATANNGVRLLNLTIHDINIADQPAIILYSLSDVLIDNCVIYNIGYVFGSYSSTGFGIKVSGTQNISNMTVSNCDISRTGSDLIALTSNGVKSDILIENNVLHENFESIEHPDGINLKNIIGCTIRNNIIYDSTQLIYLPMESINNLVIEDLYIYGNVFYNDRYDEEEAGTSPGIFIDARFGTTNKVIQNIEVYNNTFGYLGRPGIQVSADAFLYSADNIKIRNNIFNSQGASAISLASAFTNIDSDYNCYYNTPVYSGEGSHSFTADPQFSAPGYADYHLLSTSPVIDVGDPLLSNIMVSFPSPFEDIDVILRPFGSGIDFGAFEFFELEEETFVVSALSGSRATRLSLLSIPANAISTYWEITPQYEDLFTIITTISGTISSNVLYSDLSILDIWLPPSGNYSIRIKHKLDDGSLTSWSSVTDFTSRESLNSYEKYWVLSSLINTTTTVLPDNTTTTSIAGEEPDNIDVIED